MDTNYLFQQQIVFTNKDFTNGILNPYAVFKKFTDIATNHAEALGVGYNQMLAQNLFWVVMRVKYQQLADILPNQTYTLQTYPQSKNMLEFDRDFLVLNTNGNAMLIGTSKWCVIDTKTRRLARMQYVDVPCTDLPPVFNQKFLKTETFVPDFLPDYTYQVNASDIDNNGHMNNSIYAKIVFDALGLRKTKITTFQLNFLKEAMLGDRIDVYVKKQADNILVVGKKCEADLSFSAFIKTE